MIEIPEARVLARQLTETLRGRKIQKVTGMAHPHKFAFTEGDVATYPALLEGKYFTKASGFGCWVEMMFEDTVVAVSEGMRLRFVEQKEDLPNKHQLLLQLEGGDFIVASVQMYGALIVRKAGEVENTYYWLNKEAPSIIDGELTYDMFHSMITSPDVQKLSLKAFLATDQRFPGLGNGVLQDMLYYSRMHPKRKISTLEEADYVSLYEHMRDTLTDMDQFGGRNTEKDLFGRPCKYVTKMSSKTKGTLCPKCGMEVEKRSYLGGSIYFCPGCQPSVKE